MSVALRQAGLNDLDHILDIFVQSITQSCDKDYSKQQIDAWTSSTQDRARWINKLQEQYFVVAEEEGQLVAFASLDGVDYLDFMYVHSNHQRRGIASQLYDHLKSKAKELGQLKLIADVSKTARPFFESKGFRVDKENRNIINGIEVINYRMTQ